MKDPILTTLSYSGGVQSHALLEMILRGHIQRPKEFAVINADPGMEDERSYKFVGRAQERCRAAGIPFVTAKGPNLLETLLGIPSASLRRIDNPPYWTKDENGKIGRLKQCCTSYFKIEPMKRALRQMMNSRYGISLTTCKLPPVVTWIGFAEDEAHRIKPRRKKDPKYITLIYPLVEMGYSRQKVEGYYIQHGIEKPPRSVCVACYSNGLAYFEDMHNNRPDDWDIAVAVDEAVRDMRKYGVKNPCYVSQTCIPLKDLPGLNFMRSNQVFYQENRCNSGVCFL